MKGAINCYMGKGTEIDDRRQGKTAKHRPQRPEIRLRRDVPTLDIDESTPAQEILKRVDPQDYALALRDADGEVKALVVPLDRYIELASGTIAGDEHIQAVGGSAGEDRPRIQAKPESLTALHVEQVNPRAEWLPGAHPTQHLGAVAVKQPH